MDDPPNGIEHDAAAAGAASNRAWPPIGIALDDCAAGATNPSGSLASGMDDDRMPPGMARYPMLAETIVTGPPAMIERVLSTQYPATATLPD